MHLSTDLPLILTHLSLSDLHTAATHTCRTWYQHIHTSSKTSGANRVWWYTFCLYWNRSISYTSSTNWRQFLLMTQRIVTLNLIQFRGMSHATRITIHIRAGETVANALRVCGEGSQRCYVEVGPDVDEDVEEDVNESVGTTANGTTMDDEDDDDDDNILTITHRGPLGVIQTRGGVPVASTAPSSSSCVVELLSESAPVMPTDEIKSAAVDVDMDVDVDVEEIKKDESMLQSISIHELMQKTEQGDQSNCSIYSLPSNISSLTMVSDLIQRAKQHDEMLRHIHVSVQGLLCRGNATIKMFDRTTNRTSFRFINHSSSM